MKIDPQDRDLYQLAAASAFVLVAFMSLFALLVASVRYIEKLEQEKATCEAHVTPSCEWAETAINRIQKLGKCQP